MKIAKKTLKMAKNNRWSKMGCRWGKIGGMWGKMGHLMPGGGVKTFLLYSLFFLVCYSAIFPLSDGI